MILRLLIVGYGNVAQEFCRLLLAKREWLLRKKGLDVEILGIATRTHGSLLSKSAIDIKNVLEQYQKNGTLHGLPESTELSPLKMISQCDADVMVELSTLNIESGQPAIDHIRAAFDVGMDVITANKGPIAWAYDDLRDRARARSVQFRFEGTVMDGTPIFNLVERTLPGCEVLGLEGILNSTSNFVMDQMLHGSSMDQAIKGAQARGIAEADPSMDIDGWDASAKIAALANVLMEAEANPKMVLREGIRGLTQADMERAAAQGKKYKLIAKATMTDGGVRLSVKPELIGADSVFFSVDGTSSALTIRTDLMGELTMVESGPCVTQTAYAVYSDMLLTVEAIRAGTIR